MDHLTDAMKRARIADLTRQIETQSEVLDNLFAARERFYRSLEQA